MSEGGYRRDIDGLRALAILPVLAYHAHIPGFSGGFVGVDIFFVISGFLITGIIAREIDEQRFSLIAFYERRARRILPALFAMMAVVLVAGSVLYLPGDFAGLPPSALATLLFVSNVWFFSQTSYFAADAETLPLLHCWSLAVEEQFYIGFPLLLWLIARYAPGRRVAGIAGVALVSFAWAVWKQGDADGFAFFMLPPRAWELFAGALLAVGAAPQVRTGAWREALALAGLALLAFGVFGYGPQTVFPGVTALAPVLGTALLIHCAPGTLSGRLLSRPLPVGIGLISYSLYLWHWPLIVFTEYARDEKIAGLWQPAVIAAAFALAYLSWRFIERPFRARQRFDRKRIFVASGAGMATLAAAAGALMSLGGWEARFPPTVMALTRAGNDVSPRRDACLSDAIGGERPECTFGAPVAPTALLWGDSHGVEMAWALGQAMGGRGEALMQRTRGSCPPVIGYDVATDPGCRQFNEDVIARIERTPAIRQVYLAAFWVSDTYRRPGMVGWIDGTIARLQAAGKTVTLIGPVPAQPFNVPRRLAREAAMGAPGRTLGSSLADYRKASHWLTANFARWRGQGVRILDPACALATPGGTRIVAGGRPLYFDSHHLNLAGARAVLAAGPC